MTTTTSEQPTEKLRLHSTHKNNPVRFRNSLTFYFGQLWRVDARQLSNEASAVHDGDQSDGNPVGGGLWRAGSAHPSRPWASRKNRRWAAVIAFLFHSHWRCSLGRRRRYRALRQPPKPPQARLSPNADGGCCVRWEHCNLGVLSEMSLSNCLFVYVTIMR
jgi:hypothetical protein